MAKTVYDGFQEYLTRLAPSDTEVDKRKSHKKTIEQALMSEFGAFNELLVMGSHTRESAIHVRSDVDYFAKLGKDDVTRGGDRVNSNTTLGRVKKALETRFKSTDVWIDGPAVVVGFGQGAGAVDVVPGVWIGTTGSSPQYPMFDIPDTNGGWRPSAPQRHTKYLRDEDERSGFKLSKTIRLIKGWKYSRSTKIPLFGFHAEMLLASQGTCVGAKSYQNCLFDAFRLLRDRGGASLNDPVGVAGYIAATATETQRLSLVEHAKYAAEKATSAINAEVAGNINDAYYYWKLVFNQEFPSR
jgi:SMODS domain-containing protein